MILISNKLFANYNCDPGFEAISAYPTVSLMVYVLEATAHQHARVMLNMSQLALIPLRLVSTLMKAQWTVTKAATITTVLFPTVDKVHVSNKMMDLSELAMLVTGIQPTKTVNIMAISTNVI